MKRTLDILSAAFGLCLLSPVLIIVAVLIRRQMGSPVFFRQTHPGLHGCPFEMIKFRTMRGAIGADGNPLPDSERLTRLGRFLRSSSLDELPELWNVIKGEMSLVGPRPLSMDYFRSIRSRLYRFGRHHPPRRHDRCWCHRRHGRGRHS